ncbi:hypothetical protein Cgig2_024351 [Carnegiea gigantea]|uniref:Uncharacterized protein n=1 Tax=Carnegiea gigantea TaxID=171969 RepID=A0A9Q1K229_9CARY|nr:hypothetical protein Cgig2_024351 [Carnegiea gigantea]
MANKLLPVVATLFLLQLTLTNVDTDSDLVLDTNGNPLEAGSEYFIQLATGFFRRIGRTGRSSPSSCPQHLIEFNRGDPIKFIPLNETQKEIHISSAPQIDSGTSPCGDDGRSVVIASSANHVSPIPFKIEAAPGLVNTYTIAAAISAAEQAGSSYSSGYCDPASWLKMVAITTNSSEALLVYFSKYNRDVVAGI